MGILKRIVEVLLNLSGITARVRGGKADLIREFEYLCLI